MSVEELMNRIAEDGTSKPTQGSYYSRDGDCVFCHVEDVPYVAERVDELLTVYLAEDDRRLVGAQIKGVSKLPKHDVMGVELRQDDEVGILDLLLLTFTTQAPRALESGLTGVVGRKATYFDALTRLRGCTIPAADLQLT